MKTSELIRKLQEIDKTVPFDAPIVGSDDDWMPPTLTRVYHDPPRTHLVFEHVPVEPDKDSLREILNNYKNGIIPLEHAVYSICDTFGAADED